MKIMCQEYFDAVVRYAESIGDCTLQERFGRLKRWGQNARQASEVELYRDFAPYSFFSNSAMRTARSELSADWSIMARRIVPAAIRWKNQWMAYSHLRADDSLLRYCLRFGKKRFSIIHVIRIFVIKIVD